MCFFPFFLWFFFHVILLFFYYLFDWFIFILRIEFHVFCKTIVSFIAIFSVLLILLCFFYKNMWSADTLWVLSNLLSLSFLLSHFYYLFHTVLVWIILLYHWCCANCLCNVGLSANTWIVFCPFRNALSASYGKE